VVELVDYSSSEVGAWRKRRALYVTFTVVVTLIVAAAVVEALGGVPIYGVTTTEASQRGPGLEVTVRYAEVTRGQLDSPLDVQVTSASGFRAPIVVAVSAPYFDLFSVTAIRPQPTKETLDGSTWTLTFDPPDGNTFQVQWDLSARPVGWFARETGEVRVADGGPTPAVRFVTTVRP